MDEKQRRPFTVPRERYSPVAPVEPAFLATDEIGDLIDAFPRERVVCCRGSENGGTGEQNSCARVLRVRRFPPSLLLDRSRQSAVT